MPLEDFCTGGTASDPGGYEPASKAFDDSNATYAQNYGEGVWWVKYDLGVGVAYKATQQTMTSSVYGPTYMPSAWTLYGSNNGTDWTSLDARSGITWSGASQKQSWEFENTTSYRYYKWDFTNIPDGYIVVAELELMGEQTPPDAAPANYLITRMRDRFRIKGMSLGLPVLTDRYRSFLIARHNRLRVTGVSMEPAIQTLLYSYIMPPAFSSNSAPSPWVVSASSEYSADYAAWRAFIFGEQWWSNDGTGTNGAWLKVDSGANTPLLVTNVLIKNRPDSGVHGFKIQGSNNDSTWVDLYTGSAANDTTFQAFSFTNHIEYRYHRLLFTEAGYGAGYCSLSAFCLWSKKPATSPVVYDTWNPALEYGSPADYSNGNLTAACLAGAWAAIPSVRQKNSGKWYFEVTCEDAGGFFIGLAIQGTMLPAYAYYNDGTKVDIAESYTAFGAAYDSPNVIGVAVDLDARKIWFSKNGTWQASGNPAAGTNQAYTMADYPGYRPCVKLSFSQVTANFGASAFAYTPPDGFNSGWYDEA